MITAISINGRVIIKRDWLRIDDINAPTDMFFALNWLFWFDWTLCGNDRHSVILCKMRRRYYNIYFVVNKIEKGHYLCLYVAFYLLMCFECQHAINICFGLFYLLIKVWFIFLEDFRRKSKKL